MSNDLVSQHLLVSGNQMVQFESISGNLSQQIQMGFMGFGANESLSQQMPSSNVQIGQMESVYSPSPSQKISLSGTENLFFDPLLSQHGSELLSTSNQTSRQDKPELHDQGLQQHKLNSEPVGGMATMLHSVRAQPHLSTLSKRKAPMELMSNNPVLQKLSLPNKRVVQMEHRPWLQQSSSFSKRTVQMQSSPTAPVSPNMHPTNKKSGSSKSVKSMSKTQSLFAQPSPKPKVEVFESVRSKMRESLAAALALVHQERGKTSVAEKKSESEVASDHGKAKQDNCPTNSVSDSVDAVGSTAGDHQGMLSSTQDDHANGKTDSISQISKYGEQGYQSSNILPDSDVSFSANVFARDELLQGNGLSLVLDPGMVVKEREDFQAPEKPRFQNEVASHVDREHSNQSPEALALKIEEELFKLFGGVNKKYKEKGRSLLFNLKDRNNPELRERVMSGEIPSHRLCSMSAEELASKELSEWRQAKAEELAQMVVLPDTEVDIRRLVRKTHKGEFQVEVEQSDSASVEVSAGATLHNSQPRSEMKPETETKPKSVTKRKTGVKQVQAASNAGGVKEETNATCTQNKAEGQSASCTVTIPSSEGVVLMQGLVVDDEMKDPEFLPPIVSLDEFMESLDSEPPFDNLHGNAVGAIPMSNKDESEVVYKSNFPVKASEDCADIATGKPKSIDASKSNADSGEFNSDDIPVKTEDTLSTATLKGERVWEGLIQLSITTTMPMMAIFKSGERTATKEWPSMVEIKGRVRNDAFEKFLQELPMSRSRAVMVVHFVSKEGSTPKSLAEVVDSYVADARVGFAEPGSGVELYFCPIHSKTLEMLGKVLPKDQLDSLNSIDNGLIGVVVWRRPLLISPNSSLHHKQHIFKRQHFSSRKQNTNSNSNFSPAPTLPHPNPPPQDNDSYDDDDDVPPGFGPGAASRDEDDLPEFNFSGGYKLPQSPRYPPQEPVAVPSCTVDEVRQLIQKYGQPQHQPNSLIGVPMQPWNDDDDIPEWQPQTTEQHQPVVHRFQMQQLQTLPLMNVHVQTNAAQSWRQGPYWAPKLENGSQFYGSSASQSRRF